MSDVKWIKIATDIFDHEKILLIENMPEGKAIIICWFKLLTFAGKQNNSGVFMLNDKITYSIEMLATIFRMSVNIVRLAIKTFESLQMIEFFEGVITIRNWEKYQQLDALEKKRKNDRERQAKKRAQKNEKIIGIKQIDGCHATNPSMVAPLDKDKELELNSCINTTSINTCTVVSLKEDDNAVISLILNTNKYFNVYQKDVEHYQKLYPNVNILQELRNMCGWLESNPKKRKTESGIKSFITRWLAKVQNANCNSCESNENITKSNINDGWESLDDIPDDNGGFDKL